MSEDKRRSERTAIVVDEFRTRKRIIHPPLTPPPGYLPDYNWDRKRKLLFEARNLAEGADVKVGKSKSKIITIITSTTSKMSQKVLGKRRRANSDSEESTSTASNRKILPLKELVLGTRSSKRSSTFMGATALERRSSFRMKSVSPRKKVNSRSSSLTSMESESDEHPHDEEQERCVEADSETGMEVDSAEVPEVSDEDEEESEVAALLSPFRRGSHLNLASAELSSELPSVSTLEIDLPNIVKRSPRKTPSLYRVQAADDGDASSSSDSFSDIILVSTGRRGTLASTHSEKSLEIKSPLIFRFQQPKEVGTVEASTLSSTHSIPEAYFLPPPPSTHLASTSTSASSSNLPPTPTDSPATLTRLKSGALSRSSIDYRILAAGSSSFREDRLETEPDDQQRDQEGSGKERSNERKEGERESDGNQDGKMTLNGGNGAGDDEEDRREKGKVPVVSITEDPEETVTEEKEDVKGEVKEEENPAMDTSDAEIAALLLSLHSSDSSPLRLAPTIGDALAGISPAMSSSSSRSHSGTTSTNDSSAHTTTSSCDHAKGAVATLKHGAKVDSASYNPRSTRRHSQLALEQPEPTPEEIKVPPPRKPGRPRKVPSAGPSTPPGPLTPIGTRSSLPIAGSLYDLIYSPEVTLVSGGWNGRAFVTSRGNFTSTARDRSSDRASPSVVPPRAVESSTRSDAEVRATRSSQPIRETFREFTSSPLVVAAAGGWNGVSYSNPSKRSRSLSDAQETSLVESSLPHTPIPPTRNSASASPRPDPNANATKRHTRRSSPISGNLRDVLTRPDVTSVAGGYDGKTGTYFVKQGREASCDSMKGKDT